MIKKILLIEQRPFIAATISTFLTKECSYKVQNANTSQKFFHHLSAASYDLVLSFSLPSDLDPVMVVNVVNTRRPGCYTASMLTNAQYLKYYPELSTISGGILDINSPTHEIIRDIRSILASKIIHNKFQSVKNTAAINNLSIQEKTVIELLLSGSKNKQIADILNVSKPAISIYKKRGLDKLGIEDLSEIYTHFPQLITS